MAAQHFRWTRTTVSLLTALLIGGCAPAPKSASMTQYEALQQTRSQQGMKQGVSDAERTIPYSPTQIYPQDWPELTRRRQSDTP